MKTTKTLNSIAPPHASVSPFRAPMKRPLFLALLACCGLCAGGPARAAIIFDNLNSNVGGFGNVNSTTWSAQKFNSDATNFTLSSATLRLYSGSGGSGTFFLRLYADAAGQPGASIATLFTGPEPFTGALPQDGNTLFGGLSQPLTPNTNYWLVLGENTGATFDLRWGAAASPTSPPGTGSGYQEVVATTSNQGGTWGVSSGAGTSPHLMQITAVPEPGAGIGFLLGVVAVVTERRWRKGAPPPPSQP